MSLNYAGRAWAIITNAAGAAGTSLVLTTGHGARFQDGVQTTTARISKLDDPGSVEWVTITNRGTDTITVTRNSDGGGALTVTAGAYALDVVDDLGPWHSLAFDAGFFVPSGGGSLTIVAGNVISHAWRRVGFTVNYRLKLKNFSVVGIVSSIAVLFPTAAMPAGALREEGAYPDRHLRQQRFSGSPRLRPVGSRCNRHNDREG
jgi:hypothetical protein